jgi:hypothetical protein
MSALAVPRAKLTVCILCALAADACLTEPSCGCSPPGGGTAVITGRVAAPSATPIAGARVVFQLLHDGTCAEPGVITGFVVSEASGRYRHTASWSGGSKCFRLWAEPPTATAWAASDSQVVHVDYGLTGAVPDSIELNFQLRPASSPRAVP